jgi:hypothetical protein
MKRRFILIIRKAGRQFADDPRALVRWIGERLFFLALVGAYGALLYWLKYNVETWLAVLIAIGLPAVCFFNWGDPPSTDPRQRERYCQMCGRTINNCRCYK